MIVIVSANANVRMLDVVADVAVGHEVKMFD